MDRILTTHAGSLIRPPEVLAFLDAIDRGNPFDEREHEECLRRSVADIVHRQAETGIDLVSDGEIGKVSWMSYLFERVNGFELRAAGPGEGILPPSRDRQAFPEFYAEHDEEFRRGARRIEVLGARAASARVGAGGEPRPADREIWVCTGPITYESSALERDIRNLKGALEGVDVTGGFLPVVAPASVLWLKNEYYASDEEFVFALADALREEYRAIVDAGFLLQVDDAVLAHQYDTILALGGSVKDYRAWAEPRVAALNHALAGIPEDRVRYHVCWGSWHGPHVYDPPLREIVDLVLQVRAGAYSLEQANARHEHEWRLWEDVKLPDGKTLVPGVVTHSTNVVEHPELVAERITRLAKLVGHENVIAGTDCGFAQGAFLQRVHPTIQWAKLAALAEGARLATKQLWGSLAIV